VVDWDCTYRRPVPSSPAVGTPTLGCGTTTTGPGKFSTSGVNTYGTTGSYTAVVTVTDKGGRVISVNTLVAVDA
jgi:hypothetical protein